MPIRDLERFDNIAASIGDDSVVSLTRADASRLSDLSGVSLIDSDDDAKSVAIRGDQLAKFIQLSRDRVNAPAAETKPKAAPNRARRK